MDQRNLSVTQFGASAVNYLNSAVHAEGPDLDRLVTVAGQRGPARALDLGCGAGHASFALARGGARQVTAYDPSAEMLTVVAQEASTRGHAAIATLQGAAEDLPFDHDSFDLVVTRYSAHHWGSVPRALAECARVLAPGGRLVVIDLVAPESALLDTALQVIEFLRDASHVRSYRISEWTAMQRAAGFADASVQSWTRQMIFETWVQRIGTPAPRVAALRTVFADLPSEAREYFQVTADCSFTSSSAWIETPKPD